MRIFKVVSIFVLSVFLGLGIIGGCGGNGGGNNPPPGACQMPPMNTDFSDTGYGFVDDINQVLMAVTSDGETVVMAITDIPDSGALIGILATPVSGNQCDVYVAELIDEETDIVVDASGTCLRMNRGGVLELNNFEAGGIPLGVNLRGNCEVVAPIDLASLNEAVTNELESTRELNQLNQGQNIISGFVNNIE